MVLNNKNNDDSNNSNNNDDDSTHGCLIFYTSATSAIVDTIVRFYTLLSDFIHKCPTL